MIGDTIAQTSAWPDNRAAGADRDAAAQDPIERPALLDLVVASRRDEAPGIVSIALADPQGALLPAHQAGAHVDLHLGDGLVRQYSLCGDPSDRTRYRLAILRDPKSAGGSIAAHQRLVEGARIQTSAPRNHFPLREGRARSLLLAGGIGITPLLAMAYRLHSIGQDFELRYCTRSRGHTAFAQEIAGSGFAGKTHFHHDDAGADQRLPLEALLAAPDGVTDLYVCGPSGFIDWVSGAAREFGWPEDALHREYFSNAVDMTGDTFTVEARRSGKTVTVAAGQSIAQALETAGVAVSLSCEEGVCGTCRTRVLAGVPDHRDMYLSKAERNANDSIMICCSRSLTPSLALDI